jgi:hypothetical protein
LIIISSALCSLLSYSVALFPLGDNRRVPARPNQRMRACVSRKKRVRSSNWRGSGIKFDNPQSDKHTHRVHMRCVYSSRIKITRERAREREREREREKERERETDLNSARKEPLQILNEELNRIAHSLSEQDSVSEFIGTKRTRHRVGVCVWIKFNWCCYLVTREA